MKLGRLDTTIACPECTEPVHVSIPVETHNLGRGDDGQYHVALEPDMHALRLAVSVHARQHEPEEIQ